MRAASPARPTGERAARPSTGAAAVPRLSPPPTGAMRAGLGRHIGSCKAAGWLTAQMPEMHITLSPSRQKRHRHRGTAAGLFLRNGPQNQSSSAIATTAGTGRWRQRSQDPSLLASAFFLCDAPPPFLCDASYVPSNATIHPCTVSRNPSRSEAAAAAVASLYVGVLLEV